MRSDLHTRVPPWASNIIQEVLTQGGTLITDHVTCVSLLYKAPTQRLHRDHDFR